MAHEPAEPQPEPDLDDGDALVVELTADEDHGATVRVAGELDLANVDELRAVVARAVSDGVQRLVFDLAGLGFMDSSGISLLLEAGRQMSVRVARPSAAARRIIETTGLAGVLKMDG